MTRPPCGLTLTPIRPTAGATARSSTEGCFGRGGGSAVPAQAVSQASGTIAATTASLRSLEIPFDRVRSCAPDRGTAHAHPFGGGAGDLRDLVVEIRAGQAGGEVGDQGQPQHLGTEMAGGDRLQHRRHADHVAAPAAHHLDLGRRLEHRAGETDIDALGQRRVQRLRRPAQPWGVAAGQVDEARAQRLRVRSRERRHAGEVEVVADQHRLARRHAGAQAAAGIGQHHDLGAGQHHAAHAVHHLGRRMAFIEMHPAGHHQDAAVAGLDAAEHALVAKHGGRREARDLR